jgi:hypothetical protein
MAGSSATTYYDVVTRYHTQYPGSGTMRGYSNSVNRAQAGTERLRASTRMLNRAFRTLRVAIGAAFGVGTLGIVSIGIMAAKGFGNLNREMNSTITLAAQLNLGFKYVEDPAENFVKSMSHARVIFKDLVKDAAALPGEVNDFLGIARMIGVPTFIAGGSTTQFRELIGKLALAAPSTGGGFDAAGSGAMRMLQGRAILKNPLTAFLFGGELMQGHDIQSYNALKASERLRLLDEALDQLVENEMFRKGILATFDTQLGTLSETIFGTTGIAGLTFGNSFQNILEDLTDFNVVLEEKVPDIVVWLRQLGGEITDLFGVLGRLPWEVITVPLGYFSISAGGKMTDLSAVARKSNFQEDFDFPHKVPAYSGVMGRRTGLFRRGLTSEQIAENATALRLAWESSERWRSRGIDPDVMREAAKQTFSGVLLPEFQPDGLDGEHREVAGAASVVQNFHVKVAVSTDESPEVVAVRIRKALSSAAAYPTVAGRGIAALPGGGGGAESA